MSFLQYIANSTRFSLREQSELSDWYQRFSGNSMDPAITLIQRNIDEECGRADIDNARFAEFWREIAQKYQLTRPNPSYGLIDDVFQANRSYFVLQGLPLVRVPADQTLINCITLSRLIKTYGSFFGIPVPFGEQPVINALQSGQITSASLHGSTIGAPIRPVWVANLRDVQYTLQLYSADRLRDFLGLQHIESGHLIEFKYSVETLRLLNIPLQAPTLLDALTDGAAKWLFAKRASPGGPGWGHTVDLANSHVGAREAVHRVLPISSLTSPTITIGYVGPITRKPSPCDYVILARNL